MGEGVKALLAKPIKLADQVAKQSGSGQCLRPECKELRARAEKLAEVLRQAARADLYERPAERIVAGTLQALAKAGGMSARCFESHSRLRRFLTFNPVSGFPRTLALLDTAIEDVAWLIRISSPRADADANGAHDDDDDLRGLPNIAQNEPILFLIWDHIARLHTGSLAVRADSASTLASLARDNPHFSKLIVEEDGIAPLVKLLKEGTDDGQEAAATALGFLGRDEGSVEKLLHAGVCSVYSAALKEPPMRVQAAAAEAIASLAHQSPRCQDLFAQNNAVRHLVGHLAAGTIQEHSRYSVGGSSTRHAAPPPPEHMRSLHSVVLASTPSMLPGVSGHSANEPPSSSEGSNGRNNQMQSAAAGRTTTSRVTAPPPSRPQLSSNGSSGRGPRETEDPANQGAHEGHGGEGSVEACPRPSGSLQEHNRVPRAPLLRQAPREGRRRRRHAPAVLLRHGDHGDHPRSRAQPRAAAVCIQAKLPAGQGRGRAAALHCAQGGVRRPAAAPVHHLAGLPVAHVHCERDARDRPAGTAARRPRASGGQGGHRGAHQVRVHGEPPAREPLQGHRRRRRGTAPRPARVPRGRAADRGAHIALLHRAACPGERGGGAGRGARRAPVGVEAVAIGAGPARRATAVGSQGPVRSLPVQGVDHL
ncbi:hypothetical protein CFC21_058242, partial [Triticum aestivum]